MANVPHKAPLPTRTSVDDVHGGDSNSTKTSKDAGDDATDEDSLHHVLLPPFMMDCCDGVVSHHQCRSNQLRQTGREKVSLPVSGGYGVYQNLIYSKKILTASAI